MTYALLSLIALAFPVWLVLTWWHAEDKIDANGKRVRVTFKDVVQSAFRDLHEIARPFINAATGTAHRLWAFFGPRLTNLPTGAVILLDCYALQADELRSIIAHDWRGAAVLFALNLAARLSPRGAPQALPTPIPARGPGAELGYA